MKKTEFVHCALHREALAAKNMTEELKEALSIAIRSINTVKKSAKQKKKCGIMFRNGIRFYRTFVL
jgi:hypothetical protein